MTDDARERLADLLVRDLLEVLAHVEHQRLDVVEVLEEPRGVVGILELHGGSSGGGSAPARSVRSIADRMSAVRMSTR